MLQPFYPVFSNDLEQFGPNAAQSKPLSLDESRLYCRRLARRHYENFTVASLFLPRGLRQHVSNIYAYCRWADDLADEIGDPQRSLDLLDWWEKQLGECYQGRAVHPVFIALSETIRNYNIPAEPFSDLLVAFRQDQRQARYETIEQIMEYCRFSANPVGRLVLYLGECPTENNFRLSDSICSGLQIANFCQDVARDWDRGRIYLPLAECRRFGYDEAMFARRECNDAFRRLLASQVNFAGKASRRRSPAGGPDAARPEIVGGVVCPGRIGYAGGHSTAEFRCLAPPADRLEEKKTAIVDRMLVEAENRLGWQLKKLGWQLNCHPNSRNNCGS